MIVFMVICSSCIPFIRMATSGLTGGLTGGWKCFMERLCAARACSPCSDKAGILVSSSLSLSLMSVNLVAFVMLPLTDINTACQAGRACSILKNSPSCSSDCVRVRPTRASLCAAVWYSSTNVLIDCPGCGSNCSNCAVYSGPLFSSWALWSA